MGKTIKELADAIGCSKTAIRKYMDDDFRSRYTEITGGNVIVINDDGCELLSQTIKKPAENLTNQLPETSENQSLRAEIAFLRGQLEAKDRQLEAKDQQIAAQLEQVSQLTAALEHTTESLHAAQALHAGTMQQMLPDGGSDEAADADEPVVVPPEPSEPVTPAKRRGFWARLWNK